MTVREFMDRIVAACARSDLKEKVLDLEIGQYGENQNFERFGGIGVDDDGKGGYHAVVVYEIDD